MKSITEYRLQENNLIKMGSRLKTDNQVKINLNNCVWFMMILFSLVLSVLHGNHKWLLM